MNDGDWICNEQNCGNINFARRTSCYRCNAEKPEAEKTSKKKLGTEIGKSAAEKSRGLFNADDWQCNKCANVNWARRTTCNVCNAPKFGEVEARTGYGGGYNERGVVEYRRREGSSDDEYDEFGRKKRKQQRVETEDKVGITEGAEFKNLLPKPQMELKVRNCMPAPANQNKVFTEHNQFKHRFSDEHLFRDSRHSVRENEPRYQSASYKNFKYMNSNRANSFYQSRQNRKRNTNIVDREHTGSSGYETGTKKARKDSSDSPVFMSFDPVMENMVTSTNDVVYKFKGPNPSSNFAVAYTTKERVIAAAYAITYNNCKISTDRFESLFDKPAPDFKTIFAWRQRLLATGCLDDAHQEIKIACSSQVKPVRVPNPDEIAIISSESDGEGTKDQLQNKPVPQVQQRSDSVETVLLERVEKGTQGAKPPFEAHKKNSTALRKETLSSSSDSRNSNSSDTDSEQIDLKSTKSKTSTRSSRPAISSARQSAMDSDSESVSYHSDEDNFLSRKFGETKKVRRKFKRRNTLAPPATCSTPDKPVTYVPQIAQPQTNITNTTPYQGYSTVNAVEKSPLVTGNIYTSNLRNMNAKPHQTTLVENDGASGEYVPARLGAKNNYQDFKNNVRLNRPGYWARANGATLSNKRNNIPQGNNNALGICQQNRSPVKRCISTYITAAHQTNPINATSVALDKAVDYQKISITSGELPNQLPIKKHVSSFIPEIGEVNKSPRKRAISSFIPIEPQKSSTIPGLVTEKSPVKKQSSSSFPESYEHKQNQRNSSTPDHHEISPIYHRISSIPGLDTDNELRNYTTVASPKVQTVQTTCKNGTVDFTQDNVDSSVGDHYFPFYKPTKVTPEYSQDSHFVSPQRQQQKPATNVRPVDQIPLPVVKQPEDIGRIFAVLQDNSASKSRSIMDIFDNDLTKKSPERVNELDAYKNVKKPHEPEWDEDDDALYGESGNANLDGQNTSSSVLTQNTTSMDQEFPSKQTDSLKEKKEMLMGLLHSMQMNNENEQSYNDNRAQQLLLNETSYGHAQSTDTEQLQKTVNSLRMIPEPIPQDMSEELIRMSGDDNRNSCDKHSVESSPSKISEGSQKNIRNTKRIHVIESITLEPGTVINPIKQNTQSIFKPVNVIGQSEQPAMSESVEILVSSDDQEQAESPEVQTQQPSPAATQTQLSNLLAGIDPNTLLLALQNLQQLAHNSHNSSFSSTQNNQEPDPQNSITSVQPVDTINLTNDEWEKESEREGSIERQLEEMDGNPAATPFLSDIFDPCPALQNATRKLNINLKSPVNNSDTQKPDENTPVIGNFKSFALPKPPRLNRVKVPIKTSSKCSKRKGDVKKKRKKKKAAGSQDEAEAEEDEEESGDEADLAKYDLWGSEDESSKTGSSSKTASSSKTGGSSKAGTKSKEGESSKSEDLEDKNGKADSPGSKTSKKSRSRSRSSSSSTSSSTSSSSESQSSSQSASGSPKNKFDDFNLNSEREMSPRPRNSRSPRPRISAPLPRRKSHDSRGSNGDSRSHDSNRDKEWSRDRERRGERARGSRSGERKERRYSRDGGRGRHR